MSQPHKPPSVTIPKYYFPHLRENHHREKFIKGLEEIFEGKMLEDTGNGSLNEALLEIANNEFVRPSRKVQNIPSYDLEGLTPAEENRFKQVSKGWIPVNLGPDCSYKYLKFENITTVDLDTLKQLESTIKNRLTVHAKRRTKVVWLEYVLEVMGHSVDSRQLDFSD